MERVIDRFDSYMAYAGLNDNKVTVQLGLTIGLIGKSRKEGRDLSRSVIEKILDYYTDLDEAWLLTGKGRMLKEPHEEISAPAQGGQADAIVELLKEQNAELQAKVDALNQRIGELQALLKKEREEIAGAAGSSFSADAV